MAFRKRVTYETVQDVQCHNSIEITSVVIGGVRHFRAYSLLQAADPKLDARLRKSLVSTCAKYADKYDGAVLVKRYKSSNAWFFSLQFLGNVSMELKPGTKASLEIEYAMILAEALENYDAEGVGRPVHIIGKDGQEGNADG